MWKLFLNDLLSTVGPAFVAIVGENGSAPYVLLDETAEILDDGIRLLRDKIMYLNLESILIPESFSVGQSQFSNDLDSIVSICNGCECVQCNREYVRKGPLDCEVIIVRLRRGNSNILNTQ